jgi:hypothetical protein
MEDVARCFVGETINWNDTGPNAQQLIKPPADILVCSFKKNQFFFLINLQREYCDFLERAILDTGNNWFLDKVQSSIRQVIAALSTRNSRFVPNQT